MAAATCNNEEKAWWMIVARRALANLQAEKERGDTPAARLAR
jgi:hypothetical protein